ncbi:zinc finger CCCH domain-containing protein 10 isoform X2 [Procambarus clarkii]|uniref:zinc finger CCCH domain-containing protein 10 isoform X2 n=1 Tax=Procambarus clarkii TaxID=6728 RepID=UPI001E671DFF|nr:zinc finger CCCH domain-containing protein 10-like isoform X2 [Procambarus clarkii]
MQHHEMVEAMNGHAKDEGNGGGTGDDDNICRDFLRNVCRRGKRCKFRHPDDGDQGPQGLTQVKADLTFCHDYQNGHCSRPMCRFIHCTCEDEDYYLRTGDIPPHVLDQAIRKGQLGDVTLNGDVPICKDYLMGECSRRRGGKCKFRHLTQREYEQEIYGTSHRDIDQGTNHYEHSVNPDLLGNLGPPDPKRHRLEPKLLPIDFQREGEFIIPIEEIGRDILGREISLREFRERERDKELDRRGLEEILLLRKQMDNLKKENASLKKEVSDLRATNEFLLDQVTSLRLSKASGSMTAVTVPAVSLASTIPVATSVQPLTAARLSQPMPITSDGSVVALPPGPPRPPPPPQAPQQAPPQSMAPPSQPVGVAPPGPAVVGSVGGVQVSLAQVSTVSLNPQIAPATSMTPSMAPPSAQSMAQAISMSGATGHLVSYPIMTQPGLRPQLQ